MEVLGAHYDILCEAFLVVVKTNKFGYDMELHYRGLVEMMHTNASRYELDSFGIIFRHRLRNMMHKLLLWKRWMLHSDWFRLTNWSY